MDSADVFLCWVTVVPKSITCHAERCSEITHGVDFEAKAHVVHGKRFSAACRLIVIHRASVGRCSFHENLGVFAFFTAINQVDMSSNLCAGLHIQLTCNLRLMLDYKNFSYATPHHFEQHKPVRNRGTCSGRSSHMGIFYIKMNFELLLFNC